MAGLMECCGDFYDLLSNKAEDVAPIKLDGKAVIRFRNKPMAVIDLLNGKIPLMLIMPDIPFGANAGNDTVTDQE